MIKIPCLFERIFHGKSEFTLLPTVTPGCEWVMKGEGRATIKWDGTACLIKDGKLFKRYDAKINPRTGARKSPPEGAIPCQPEPDPVTGHWPHWVEVDPKRPEDKWHAMTWELCKSSSVRYPNGTYELVGECINGNPHGFSGHTLIKHGSHELDFMNRSFEALWDYMLALNFEGLVFHHPDGRMCKIRRVDFGFSWPLPKED